MVWDNCAYASIVQAAPTGEFATKLLWWSSKLDKNELREIMTIAWAIWFCRNKLVYAQETLNVQTTMDSFLKMVSEYGVYKQKVIFSPSTIRVPSLFAATWAKPPREFVKVNVDAHVVEGRYVGLGAVLRDHQGKVLMMAVKRIETSWNATMTEAAAARFAVQMARRYGFGNVFEGDAINVVMAVNKALEGCAPIFVSYDDIRMLSMSFSNFKFSHVRRGGNTVAHLVARWDTRGSEELVCMEPIPQSVLTLADLDLQ